MKRIAIINPASAAGRTGRSVAAITARLEGLCDRIVITSGPGHAQCAAREGGDCDTIIVVGGDGTVNEVLQGMDHSRQSLAVFPSGTGNSLARDLRISSFGEGLRVLNSGTIRQLDALEICVKRKDGSLVNMLAASTVSFGYAARVSDRANRSLKWLGRMCYPVSAFVNTIYRERLKMRVAMDENGSRERTLSCLLVSNTRHAANFEVFPDASMNDGLFDVMELDLGFFRQNLHNISVLSSMHFYAPVEVRNARRMRITPYDACNILVDGEIIGNVTDCTIKILPGRISCFCTI